MCFVMLSVLFLFLAPLTYTWGYRSPMWPSRLCLSFHYCTLLCCPSRYRYHLSKWAAPPSELLYCSVRSETPEEESQPPVSEGSETPSHPLLPSCSIHRRDR